MPRRPKRTKTLNRSGYDGNVYETVSAASDPGDLTRIADSIGVKIRLFPT